MIQAEHRYAIAPQMRLYDQLPLVLAPYVTTTTRSNFQSAVVNTDDYGFRISYAGRNVIDTASWWSHERRAILLGGSFAFGIGTTGDEHTLASVLAGLTPYAFLNLGIRAANSTQELIASIPFLESAECVVVCSGVNNLVVAFRTIGGDELFGPVFNESVFRTLGGYGIRELEAIIQSRIGGLGVRALFREIHARFCAKAFPRTRKAPDKRLDELPVETPPLSGLKTVAEAALARQRRDLSILAKALPPKAKLLFAIQPFADTTGKALCQEERQLFELTDGLQGAPWRILKTSLWEVWPSYVAGLKKICARERVNVLDLNAVELSGWSYVDRVHMTDQGYRQVADLLAKVLA